MKHLGIEVEGIVQGVCFRAAASAAARRLAITGFVRNEPDGSVHIEAEGGEAALTEFVAWCWQGPPHAEVKSVRATAGQPAGYTGFHIRW